MKATNSKFVGRANRELQDCVEILPVEDRTVFIVADGAGGISGGFFNQTISSAFLRVLHALAVRLQPALTAKTRRARRCYVSERRIVSRIHQLAPPSAAHAGNVITHA